MLISSCRPSAGLSDIASSPAGAFLGFGALTAFSGFGSAAFFTLAAEGAGSFFCFSFLAGFSALAFALPLSAATPSSVM